MAAVLYVCSAFVVWVFFMPPVQADNVLCPSSCTCLGNNVDCSNFGLVNIPKDIPIWATRLELQSNSISEIRPDDFKGLHNLQYLDLSKNNINLVNGSVFKDLTGLQTLKMDYNKLTAIPLFPAPLNIVELTLTHNHIVTIPLLAMIRMPELLTMDLSNNYILSITNGSFPAGSKLTSLNLNSNQISVIEQGSLSNLTLLELLKVNKNKLSELPVPAFNHLSSLKTLDLMRNKIRSIKGLTFQGLNKLQALKLQRNNIVFLTDGAFWGLPNLINLHLDHNKIINITQAWLFGLKMLKTLSLSYNKISRIEKGAWEPCRHLAKLDLTHNKLMAITESSLAQLTSLNTLLLDHNQISRIDEGAFRDQEDLSTLEINSNQISWTMEDYSGAFRGLTGLTKLGLRANAVRSIAVHAFAGLPKLRQLHLEDNDITSVQENAFETLRDLRDLRFNSSKLFCDCHLAWLPPWLKQNGFQQSAIGTCFHPPVLRGATIFQVDVADFKCNKAEFPKPVILESPKSANGYKGENLTLTCITAITGDSQPRIYWKKDNMVLNESLSTIIASSDGSVKRYTSNLHLIDIQDSMAGSYQCIVSNDFGSSFSQRAYINVYVYPVFLKVPRNVTVKAGKPAELKCAATGQPTPVISWQKDGGDNFPAARERRMQVYPNDDRFYILNTRTADEGVYSCMARNEAGVVVTNATVTVLVPPFIEQPMQSKKISKKGETTVLQCMASGSPQPKLTWLKDDKELVVTPRHFFTVDNRILVVVDTQWSDAGTYACRMSNSLGTAKGTTELQVSSSSGEAGAAGSSFGLDDESTTTGIIIIAVVCCVVGTSLVWVIIIYQTRKRHEVYSATPTDETTLPGEIPSSGYGSSDKEGSCSQGNTTANGYHYQDYQMKESGYESSGQFQANGYTRPAICSNDADEDDSHTPTLTAGDLLLRQIKAAKSVSSLPYPASDGDTLGSRHSTSSDANSGSTGPPSSHSDQAATTHFPVHYQLHVVTSQGDDQRRNPSPSKDSPSGHKLGEHPSSCFNQQLVSCSGRPLLQTFHPMKPTNHDRPSETSVGGAQSHRFCGGETFVRGCENGHHCDSCDNLDPESVGDTMTASHLHCSVCMSKYSVMVDSNTTNGCQKAHVEIHPTNGNHVCCLHGTKDRGGGARLHCGTFSDSSGCCVRHFCGDNHLHCPTSLSQASPSSLLPIHHQSDGIQRQTRNCGSKAKKSVHVYSEPGVNGMRLCPLHSDSSQCDCSTSVAGPASTPCWTTPSSGTNTLSPCFCEIVRDPCCGHMQLHHSEKVTDNAVLTSCPTCACQHHGNHPLPPHTQQQLCHRHSAASSISRSRSAGSVGHDPKYCAHSDPLLSPVHTDCGSYSGGDDKLSTFNQSYLCNHTSCPDHKNNLSDDKSICALNRAHCQGRLPHATAETD